MKKACLLFLILSLIYVKAFSQGNDKAMLSHVYDYCRALLLSDTAYATEQSYRLTDDVKYNTDGAGYFKTLTTEGNWADIDYHSDQRSAWLPSWHLYRLMLVARVYNKNHDATYLNAIHHALAYWIKNDLQCSNWWQNQINTPYTFSSLMIMLGREAKPEELTYLNTVLAKRAEQKNPTGQNLIWQLDNQARIALVQHDETAFAALMKRVQTVISVSAKEGIQPDYSFQQHGVMLQFGNYGMHFVNSLLFWMTVTTNTPFAFDKEKQQVLIDYCTNGLRWTVFKGAMDITAIGRQLRNNADTKRGLTLYDDFNLLKRFDKTNGRQYALDGFDNAASYNLNGNKSFWRSDYMVQLRQGKYLMSVKTHGLLVKRIESINSENLRGAYLNDGVTLVQHTGKEYHNIEALWDWRMLPGTTTDTTINTESKEAMASSNISDFVGQVSDGKWGISAMAYDRLGVKAHKSVFLIDGMMVCLGAGITSANQPGVITTVNQQFFNAGEFTMGQNNAQQPWVWHDGTAYIFPEKNQRIDITHKNIQGNWGTIDKASGEEPVRGEVFKLSLSQAVNNSYVYAIEPGVDAAGAEKLANKPPFKIIANTTSLQAIALKDGVMAVFYTSGNIIVNKKDMLTVDAPCLVLYKPGTITISDPTHKLQQVNLSLNKKTFTVKFPQGDMAGATIKIDL